VEFKAFKQTLGEIKGEIVEVRKNLMLKIK